MSSERRRSPRYQFIADAEIVDIEADAKFRVKTGDLSLGGCFLDMLNPSPENTEIRITIFWGGTKFTGVGRVVFVFPNLGMGVAFTEVAEDQLDIMQEWLRDVSLGRPLSSLS